jgi:hypothetical protein
MEKKKELLQLLLRAKFYVLFLQALSTHDVASKRDRYNKTKRVPCDRLNK